VRHRCRCGPGRVFLWTHSQLTAAHLAHPDGVQVGPHRYDIVSEKVPTNSLHKVKFVKST